MTHLSDEEIQVYLDRGAPEGPGPATDHLRDCPTCRRLLAQYRGLYGALADESCFAAPSELATRVLSSLRARGKERAERDHFDTLVAIWGVLMALVVAGWAHSELGGFSAYLQPAFEAFREYLDRASDLLTTLRYKLAPASRQIGLVVAGAFVAYVIFALDYLVSLPVRKRAG